MSKVVVVAIADDWEGLYVDGRLVWEGHTVQLRDLEAHLPDFSAEDYPASPEQLQSWGYRCPPFLEALT